MLGMFEVECVDCVAYWGELVFLQTSYPAGSRKPLIRWIGKTQIDGVMAYVALGKDDRIAWCWTSWSKVCDSDRIVPSPSRSASGPWCWVGQSVMFLFDCWLAGWPFISNPWCGSSVGHVLRSVEVLLDTLPRSPKNCPEAKGGSVRVQISLLRPVSFLLVKPRSFQIETSSVQSSQVVPWVLSKSSPINQLLIGKNTLSYNQLIAELFSCRVPLLGSWIMTGGRV
ncbi:hypothetical protein DY000_02054779 [Brassica cretica]|uniref:Uncharacterized protein n=1 Tax=Brassica cretica TaxID=69181 RepID=A0ABQ7AES6_BRACR|nr:hypothetical protein DY000_02054779 [Brassica cretica]